MQVRCGPLLAQGDDMIRKIIVGSLFVLAAITGVYVRFAHPDLTETQLLIDFWYVWLCIVMAVMAVAILLKRYDA